MKGFDGRRVVGRICLFLGALILLPGLLLTAFERTAVDEGLYTELFTRHGSAALGGITDTEMEEVAHLLAEYLSLRSDSLEMTVEGEAGPEPVFHQREISHMEDVRALFERLNKVKCTLLFDGIILLALGAACLKTRAFAQMQTDSLISTAVWLGLFILVAVACAVNFTATFDLFHRLLFRNELWMMDPRTDRMIRMMPEAFFLDIALRCARNMGIITIGYVLVGSLPAFVMRRVRNRAEGRNGQNG